MIEVAEEKLLLAVRDRLRTIGCFEDRECDVDFDEEAPSIAGDNYIVVMPGGIEPDYRHKTSGGINGLLFGVSVASVKRLGKVPRDRRKNTFLANLRSITADMATIYAAIDWKYEVTTAANAAIELESGIAGAFIHPLVWQGMDQKPKLVGPEFFGASGSDHVGMVRTCRFSGALIMTSK